MATQVIDCHDGYKLIGMMFLQMVPEFTLGDRLRHLEEDPGSGGIARQSPRPVLLMVAKPEVSVIQEDKSRVGRVINNIFPVI